MAKKKTADTSILAPVDDYPEKTDDVRTEDDDRLAEARFVTTDQVPDYRDKHDLSVEDRPINEVEEAMRALRAEQLGVDVDALSVTPTVQPSAEDQAASENQ